MKTRDPRAELERKIERVRNGLRAVRGLMPGKRAECVVVEIAGAYPARTPRRPFFGLPLPAELGMQQTSLEELTRDLEALAQARSVKRVVFRIGGLRVPRLATAWALRRAIAAVRAAGKKTTAILSHVDSASYYIASAAETVVVPESADFWLHGMAVSTVFLRDTLARFGVRFEKLAIAEYKNAFDELVRQEMSEAQREQLDALLDSMFATWAEDVAQSRHLTADAVRAAIDEGLTSATRARELGLIDRVAYEDEVLERGAQSLDDAAQALPVTTPLSRKRVAVVSLLGGIIVGQSRRSPTPVPVVGGVMAGSETIIRCLRAAAEDDSTAAVVLHVDSGGGSALASDLIWREVQLLRAKKPVVGVMEGVAASGGYYVLAGCNRIIAAPHTITGSIGVVMGKLVLEGAYQKAGANPQHLSRGRFGLMFNPGHGFTDEERALMERYGREVYDRFVARVADGRRLTRERVNEIGRGRVWTGRDALTNGLIDELGDMQTAIDRACELGGLPAGAPTWNVRAPAQMLLPTSADPTTWQRTVGALLDERALLLAPPWALSFGGTT